MTDAPFDPWLGQCLAGRYELRARLGSGAVGRVYRARQLPFDRVVAVKLLRTDTTPEHYEQNRKRFRREAEQLARLSHPNVVRLYDWGIADDETAFLVMEYLEGRTLRAAMGTRPLPPDQAVALGIDILRGLRHCHDRGVVHRDLKPDNVQLVADDGGVRPILVDFGISRDLDASTEMTVGTFLGTPAYASPEQATDDPIDHRSDLYAFGVLLYRMLTGNVPFRGKSGAATMFLHVNAAVPAMASRGVEIDEALESIVARCLAKHPGDRWPDANSLRQALRAWRTGGAVPTPSGDGVRRVARLPDDTAPVGRVADVRGVNRLLREHRLVTITGPGGVGKSALAVHLAHTAPGGLLPVHVGAGGLDGPAALATEVARAIGEDPASGTWSVAASLRSVGPAILVVDDADPILRHGPVTLARWLEDAPELRVLVTSREPVGIPGEAVYELPPLPWDDAVGLFLRKARSKEPSYASNDAEAVASLVGALDRLPLSILFAAERAGRLSPRELLVRLDGMLDLLRTKRRAGLARHASLRTCLDWSWARLDGTHRRALAQLSLFRGPVRVSAAEALLALDGGRATDVLERLRAASWLRSDDDDQLTWWRATHVYARERWASLPADERAATRARYVDWAHERATTLWEASVGADAAATAQAQQDELGDLLTAHDLADDQPERAASLIGALFGPLRRAGRRQEHLGRLEATLRHDISPAARVKLLNQVASLTAEADRPRARAVLEEALALHAVHPGLDPSITWVALGNIELLAGERDASRQWYERALGLLESRGDDSGTLAMVLNNLALVAKSAGKLGRAREYLKRALVEHERVGALPGVALACLNLGDLALAVRDHPGARAHYERAADVYAQLGDRMRSTLCVTRAGLVELDRGRPRNAEDALRGGLFGLRSGGFLPGVGEALTWLAVARADQDDRGEAERLLADAAEVYTQVVRRHDEARVFVFKGALLAHRGATADADVALDRATALLAQASDPRLEWAAAMAHGLVHLAQGNRAEADQVLRSARKKHGKRTPAGTALEIRVLARWLERALAAAARR